MVMSITNRYFTLPDGQEYRILVASPTDLIEKSICLMGVVSAEGKSQGFFVCYFVSTVKDKFDILPYDGADGDSLLQEMSSYYLANVFKEKFPDK